MYDIGLKGDINLFVVQTAKFSGLRSKVMRFAIVKSSGIRTKLTQGFFMTLLQILHHGQSIKWKGKYSALACDIQALTVSRKSTKKF